MAKRRMFTAELIDSDQFTDMSIPAQMLYVNLAVHADDEGFLSSGKRLSAPYGGENTLEEISRAGLIIRFDSGVLVITDWFLQNTIRKDRSSATNHQAERKQLTILDGRYMLCSEEIWDDSQMVTNCQPSDNQVSTNSHPIDDHVATQNRTEQTSPEKTKTEYITPDQNIQEKKSEENITPVQSVECINEGNGWAFGDYLETIPREQSKPDSAVKKTNIPQQNCYPTFQQVMDFCKKEGLEHINVLEFWRYFEKKSWYDKENLPVHDWHAMARSWDARNKRLAT